MSDSQYAELFFGICEEEVDNICWQNIGRDNIDPDYFKSDDNYIEDWEHIYAANMGASTPVSYEERSNLVKASSCIISIYGNMVYGRTYPFVAVKESLIRIDWSKKVPPLTIKAEWVEQLRTFCKTMNIKYQEPRWWIVASYG